jgi:hypothetical protein
MTGGYIIQMDGLIYNLTMRAGLTEFQARAALEAMRDWPDELPADALVWNNGPYAEREVRRIWRSLIEAALKAPSLA